MKQRSRYCSAFSLVEITLALGVAAFCLIAVLGMLPVGLKTQQASSSQTKANAVISQVIDSLRADVRLPPGQASKAEGEWVKLHGHWLAVAVPDNLFFTIDGDQTGAVTQGPPPAAPTDAVFRVTVTYLFPPTATTSVAKITVSWPAAQSDLTKVAGSIDMFAAVNR
jgi:type II secretory pathway pseudopilin PulG